MIPFVAKEIRFLLACQYVANHSSDMDYSIDVLHLYENPTQYFLGKGAQHVIECYGDEQQQEDDKNEPSVDKFIIKKGDNGNYPQDIIHWKNGKDHSVQMGFDDIEKWIFKPYNLTEDDYPNEKKQAYQDMKEKVRDWLQRHTDKEVSWYNILTSKKRLNKLRKFYGEFFKKDLNSSSLFVRSFPEKGGVLSYYPDRCCCIEYDRCHYQHQGSTLLTGDGFLKGKTIPKLKKDEMLGENESIPLSHHEIGDYKENTMYNLNSGNMLSGYKSVIQLPHHGAKDNIDLDALLNIESCSILVASHGRKNRYRHPSKSLITEITSKCLRYVGVNEKRDFSYTVHWGN
jgi:hypothetical protein